MIVEIREMRRDDIDEVSKLYYQGFWDKFKALKDISSNDAINLTKKFMFSDDANLRFYKVAVVNDQVVGMIKFLCKEDKESFGSVNRSDYKKFGLIKMVMTGILLLALGQKIEKDNLYIDTIVVDEDYRGMGIGQKLLEKAFEETELKDKKNTSLMVIKSNESAKRLYENMGFKTVKSGNSKLIEKLSDIDGYYFMKRI